MSCLTSEVPRKSSKRNVKFKNVDIFTKRQSHCPPISLIIGNKYVCMKTYSELSSSSSSLTYVLGNQPRSPFSSPSHQFSCCSNTWMTSSLLKFRWLSVFAVHEHRAFANRLPTTCWQRHIEKDSTVSQYSREADLLFKVLHSLNLSPVLVSQREQSLESALVWRQTSSLLPWQSQGHWKAVTGAAL